MTKTQIIDLLHRGGSLVKYKDAHWSGRDRHGTLQSDRYIQGKTACAVIAGWPGGLHYCKRGDYEEWRRKAGVHHPDPPAPRAGICRVCGCNPRDACWIDPPGENCSWTDASQTLCNHPKCLAKAVPGA